MELTISRDMMMTIALGVLGEVIRANGVTGTDAESIEAMFDEMFEKRLDAAERDAYMYKKEVD